LRTSKVKSHLRTRPHRIARSWIQTSINASSRIGHGDPFESNRALELLPSEGDEHQTDLLSFTERANQQAHRTARLEHDGFQSLRSVDLQQISARVCSISDSQDIRVTPAQREESNDGQIFCARTWPRFPPVRFLRRASPRSVPLLRRTWRRARVRWKRVQRRPTPAHP